MEKTVLGDDSKQVSDDLEIIKIDHRRVQAGKAGELPEFRMFGNRLGEDAWIKPFLDRDFTYISVRGMSGEEGNGSIVLRINGDHGQESYNSRRRAVKLTVFVPKSCVRVGVQGGLNGFKVRGVFGTLAVRGRSEDRDYEAVNEVSNLKGSFEAEDLPIHRIESVAGDVTITRTVFDENISTIHDQNGVSSPVPKPRPLSVADVGGNIRGRFSRGDVTLERINGRVDVENEFGRTVWVVSTPPAKRDHRIVSQAGTIEFRLSPKVLGDLDMNLATECGALSLDPESSSLFESFHITLTDGDRRCSFHGFARRNDGRRDSFALLERVPAALHGRKRDPGIDLISRGGLVRIVARP